MTFEMNLNPVPFNMIITKRKDVEMRLLTEERKKINIGDYIVFKNTVSGKLLTVEVTGIHTFKTFKELYKFFPKERLGYLSDEVADYQDMYEYYSKESIEKFGVIGFEIKIV